MFAQEFRSHSLLVLVSAIVMAAPAAQAGSVNWGPIETNYSLVGQYAGAMRLHDPSDGVINAPGREEVPITEDLKFPESHNFDDGDRNFRQNSIVNNRITGLGEVEFKYGDFGFLARADGFYDRVYQKENDNFNRDSINRIDKDAIPTNEFNDDASYRAGGRARFLDTYAYGTFFFGENMVLNARLGRHIAAWGQSLFFSGVAITQATADATKATVPGADVKSILLPVNQLSARFTATNKLTFLGQYIFEFKPFELNPVGEFYSVADVVGPGAEMAYGIKNPFDPQTLASLFPDDLNDAQSLSDTIQAAFNPDGSGTTFIDTGPVTSNFPLDNQVNDLLGAAAPPTEALLAQAFENVLPDGIPEGLNPTRGPDILPDKDDKQWGIGAEYALSFTTTVGAYYLKYHNKTPAPVFNFPSDPNSGIVLIPGVDNNNDGDTTDPGDIPATDTVALNLFIPATYQVRYYDNVNLYAVGMSTVFMGLNWGLEAIRRQGVDVLVDVDEGIAGIVPTPTRANSSTGLINAIYAGGPKFFWDSFTFVAEVGYTRVDGVKGATSSSRRARETARPGSHSEEELNRKYTDLSFDKEAFAFATLSFIDVRNITPGWDLRIPISLQGQVKGRAAVAGTFGSLFSQDDYRFGFSFDFTRLQNFTMGVGYNGFIGGKADFLKRPLQDRDVIFANMKYNFF